MHALHTQPSCSLLPSSALIRNYFQFWLYQTGRIKTNENKRSPVIRYVITVTRQLRAIPCFLQTIPKFGTARTKAPFITTSQTDRRVTLLFCLYVRHPAVTQTTEKKSCQLQLCFYHFTVCDIAKCSSFQQDRQCTCNATLRRVHVVIVAVEKQ